MFESAFENLKNEISNSNRSSRPTLSVEQKPVDAPALSSDFLNDITGLLRCKRFFTKKDA